MFSKLKPRGGTTLVLPCCHTNTLHTLTVNNVPNLRLLLLLFVALPQCLLGGSGCAGLPTALTGSAGRPRPSS